MSIGSTIAYSVPAVGTTVASLSKAKDGVYSLTVETGDVDVPILLTLRPATVTSLNRKLGASWQFRPNVLDTGDALTNGRVSVSFNVDGMLGSNVTRTALLNHIRWFFGALLQTNLLEALVDGGTE